MNIVPASQLLNSALRPLGQAETIAPTVRVSVAGPLTRVETAEQGVSTGFPQQQPPAEPLAAVDKERRFQRDAQTDEILFQVIDTRRDEVMFQMPDEMLLRMRKYYAERQELVAAQVDRST